MSIGIAAHCSIQDGSPNLRPSGREVVAAFGELDDCPSSGWLMTTLDAESVMVRPWLKVSKTPMPKQ